MQLLVLGSGTAIPHRMRGASGYALRADSGEVLLLECGPGSTRRWPGLGITFASVRAVLVTHHHVDHCSDLAAVMFGRNVVEGGADTPVTWLGPRGHARHLEGLERVYGSSVREASGERVVVELADGDAHRVGPFELQAREVLHVEGSIGIRVRCDGRTVAFSGDSGACPALVSLCRGVDLALLECSYPAARPTTRHLNTTTAARVALEAAPSLVVLTHFYPSCDDVDVEGEVRAAGYNGPLLLARDGLVVEVGTSPPVGQERRV